MKPTELQAWLMQRLPAEVLVAPPDVRVYVDEVLIILSIAEADGNDEDAVIARRREETRPLRMRLAREIQAHIGLPVAWGMRSGAHEHLFTSRTAPVMTRLNRVERDILDTLVAAGVAETRSAALAYVVRAFASEHADWLLEARETIVQLERIRSRLTLTPNRGAPPAERD